MYVYIPVSQSLPTYVFMCTVTCLRISYSTCEQTLHVNKLHMSCHVCDVSIVTAKPTPTQCAVTCLHASLEFLVVHVSEVLHRKDVYAYL